MDYPGRVVRTGERDAALVRAIKARLNATMADPASQLDSGDGSFGPRMSEVVRQFQARHTDSHGRALKQDGELGPLTWQALFEDAPVHRSATLDPRDLLGQVLLVAATEVEHQVREEPRNSNRGPRVEQYLASVGLPGGHAWCCAFVHWCFQTAAAHLRVRNPMVRTGGCLDHWKRSRTAGATRLPAAEAVDDPRRVLPGMIFVMDHGHGLGHTGLVEQVDGGWLTTIEGNTDASRTREGGGVYRLQRKVGEINAGYILY